MGDVAAERESLLAAYRSGAQAPDFLAGRAGQILYDAWSDDLAALAADDLLSERLLSQPAYPIWMERRLTEIRRRFLFEGAAPEAEPLLARLAIQCHLNEYAWALDPVERLVCDRMADGLDSLSPVQAMALACYRPLASLPGAEALLDRGWTGPVAWVLAEQVSAVLEERRLGAALPAITPIRAGVSQAVRAQYEANSYPRWRNVRPIPVQRTIFGAPIPPSPDVLFAGCGTGHHAILAGQRYAGARILAVDLSRASLGYAARKTREAGIGNMTYAQADLLELGGQPLRFDVIECSGVLHHLADPFEGARAICGVLKPGGLLKIGLYSRTARMRLRPAKALARSYGPETIREFRQAIVAAPQGDPVKAPMRSADFYSTSACRDLLMHVQEHELEIADLKRLLDENGLTLLGMATGEDIRRDFVRMFPDDPRAVSLDNWDAYERAKPDTFAGMYQFWARKDG